MTTTTKAIITVTAVAVFSIPFMLHHPPVAPPKKQNAQTSNSDASVAKDETGAEKRHYRPAPVTRQVQQTVNDFIRRYQGMTKEQLQRSPELNKLMNRFIAVINTPEMEDKVTKRLMTLPRANGAEGGTLRMDFDMLDDAHGRAWLEAAVSNEPQRIEDWILNTLDDATFEFAFDPDLERTSNGVSLQPTKSVQPPADEEKEKD